jgi:chromosome segregation ATPase
LTNDIGRTFAERVAGLVAETLKIDNSLNEFLGTVTSDFNSLVNQIDQMRGNLQMLKEEVNRTTSELNRLKIEENAKKQPQFQATNV